MDARFSSQERLTHEKEVSELFDSKSQNLKHQFAYPIKMVYTQGRDSQTPLPKVLISVSKRRFKRAVDRNLLKRRMREAYRLHKQPCVENDIRTIGLIFVGKTVEPYSKIEQAFLRCLKEGGLS